MMISIVESVPSQIFLAEFAIVKVRASRIEELARQGFGGAP